MKNKHQKHGTLYACHTSALKVLVLKGPAAQVPLARVTLRIKVPVAIWSSENTL